MTGGAGVRSAPSGSSGFAPSAQEVAGWWRAGPTEADITSEVDAAIEVDVAIEVDRDPPVRAVPVLDTASLGTKLEALGQQLQQGAGADKWTEQAHLSEELSSVSAGLRELELKGTGDPLPLNDTDNQEVQPLVRRAVKALRDLGELAGPELARTRDAFWAGIKKACAALLIGIVISIGLAGAAVLTAATATLAPVICAALAVSAAALTVGVAGYVLYQSEKQRAGKQRALEGMQEQVSRLLWQLRPARQPEGSAAEVADRIFRDVPVSRDFLRRLEAAGDNEARLRLAEEVLAPGEPLDEQQRRNRADRILGALVLRSSSVDVPRLTAAQVEVCTRLLPLASPARQWQVFRTLTFPLTQAPDENPPETALIRRHLLAVIPFVDPTIHRMVVERAAAPGLKLLADADLRNWDLADMDLSGAVLARSDLSGAHLEGTRLTRATLMGVNFTGAHLQGASLDRSHMDGANFSGANLQDAKLEGNLEGANFSGANLAGAQFGNANLHRANLSHVDVTNLCSWHPAGLGSAALDGINLTGVDLTSSSGPPALRKLDSLLMNRCLLTDAKLDPKQINEAIAGGFSTYRVDGMAALDHDFHHLANNGRSVLVSINSLPEEHQDDKRWLVETLLRELDKSISTKEGQQQAWLWQHPEAIDAVLSSVAVFLLENPEYCDKSKAIQAFMQKHQLIERALEYCQKQLIVNNPAFSARWAMAMLKIIGDPLQGDSGSDEARHSAQKFNFAIFQVLYLARKAAIKERAARAGGASEVAPGEKTELEKSIDRVRALYLKQMPDSLQPEVNEVSSILFDGSVFPLLADDSQSALLLTDDSFDDGIGPDPMWGKSSILELGEEKWVPRAVGQGKAYALDPAAAPVLSQLYLNKAGRKIVLAGLLHLLPEHLAEQAVAEMDCGRRPPQVPPWTDAAVMDELRKCMQGDKGTDDGLLYFPSSSGSGKVAAVPDVPVVSAEVPEGSERPEESRRREVEIMRTAQLRPEVYQQLRAEHAQLLIGVDGLIDPRKEAFWCRCWAAVLAMLSSSVHFGEEHDSPVPVRVMAIAMLNAAHALDARRPSPQTQDWRTDDVADRTKLSGDWQLVEVVHRITGRKTQVWNVVFTCTAVLGQKFKKALRSQAAGDKDLMVIYSALIPAEW